MSSTSSPRIHTIKKRKLEQAELKDQKNPKRPRTRSQANQPTVNPTANVSVTATTKKLKEKKPRQSRSSLRREDKATCSKFLLPKAFRTILAKITLEKNSQRNFLDLGSGTGKALEFFKAEGFKVKGVELVRDHFTNTPTEADVIEADLNQPNYWLQELLKVNLLILINNQLFDSGDMSNMERYIMKVAPEGTWIVTTAPSFQRQGHGDREPSATLEGVQMAFQEIYLQPYAAEYASWKGNFTMYYYQITKRGHPFPQLPLKNKATKDETETLITYYLKSRGIRGEQLTTKGSWESIGLLGVKEKLRGDVIKTLDQWFKNVTTPSEKKVQEKKTEEKKTEEKKSPKKEESKKEEKKAGGKRERG